MCPAHYNPKPKTRDPSATDNAGMKRRLLRLWPVWSAVLTVLLLGSFIAWRSSQAEFSFLAGHKPTPVWKGRDNLYDFYAVTESDSVYAFRADSASVIAQADRLLLIGAGWKKVVQNWPPGEPHNEFVCYTEPQGLKRYVLINPNCTLPTGSLGVDFMMYTPEYRPGWVCVTVLHSDIKLGWWDLTRSWLGRIFLGRP